MITDILTLRFLDRQFGRPDRMERFADVEIIWIEGITIK
jgi:hypothetical protein